jgi:transposase
MAQNNNKDFTAEECQAEIKYLFLKESLAKKIEDDMLVTLGDKHPSISTVKNWVARFRAGHLNTEDEEHSGRQTPVAIQENVDTIHSMILDDQRLSTK